MAGTECVIFRLGTAKKTAQPAKLLDGMQLVPPAREYLVCIRLMSHIPNKPIPRRVENVMHRNRELDRTQARTGVAANPRTCIDDELPHFVGDLLKVVDPKLSEVGR